MRTSLLIAISLFLGFGLGWITRHRSEIKAAPHQTALATDSSLPAGSPITPTLPLSPAPLPESTGKELSNDYRNHVKTLQWLKQSGVPVLFRGFAQGGPSPAMAKLLELTDTESARLNEADLKLNRELSVARLQLASSSISEDGKILIVQLPSIDASTSRMLFEDFLSTMKSTLGPDRYEMFNELSGDNFDRSYDQFGLNHVRYELELEPKSSSMGSLSYFAYKRYNEDPTKVSKGWSGSTQSYEEIVKTDPLLAPFIPRHLQTPKAK